MTKNRQPSSHGIVVKHKESGLLYASYESNFDPDNEVYVRDLRIGESVFSYPVKGQVAYEASEAALAEAEAAQAPEQPENALSGGSEGLTDAEQEADRQAAASRPNTEGAAPAGSPEKKEGN